MSYLMFNREKGLDLLNTLFVFNQSDQSKNRDILADEQNCKTLSFNIMYPLWLWFLPYIFRCLFRSSSMPSGFSQLGIILCVLQRMRVKLLFGLRKKYAWQNHDFLIWC